MLYNFYFHQALQRIRIANLGGVCRKQDPGSYRTAEGQIVRVITQSARFECGNAVEPTLIHYTKGLCHGRHFEAGGVF